MEEAFIPSYEIFLDTSYGATVDFYKQYNDYMSKKSDKLWVFKEMEGTHNLLSFC